MCLNTSNSCLAQFLRRLEVVPSGPMAFLDLIFLISFLIWSDVKERGVVTEEREEGEEWWETGGQHELEWADVSVMYIKTGWWGEWRDVKRWKWNQIYWKSGSVCLPTPCLSWSVSPPFFLTLSRHLWCSALAALPVSSYRCLCLAWIPVGVPSGLTSAPLGSPN